MLFAQQIQVQAQQVYQAWTPDWWIEKVEKYTFSGCIAALVVYLLWRYLPRAIEAFIEYMRVTTTSNQKVAEATHSLVDSSRKQDELTRQVAASQLSASQSAAKMVDLHTALVDREEAVIARACDLVEMVTARVAPDMLREVKQHTEALRAISHRPPRAA